MLYENITTYLHQQTEVVSALRTSASQVVQELESCIRQQWPSSTVEIYGSYATGQVCASSDVDVVVWFGGGGGVSGAEDAAASSSITMMMMMMLMSQHCLHQQHHCDSQNSLSC